jgi:hypothetical protein
MPAINIYPSSDPEAAIVIVPDPAIPFDILGPAGSLLAGNQQRKVSK